MLSPEVWQFPDPPTCSKTFETSFNSIIKKEGIAKEHYFNHGVCVLFPETMQLPQEVKQFFEKDSQFYKVCGLSPDCFIHRNFINAFVKKGRVTAVGIGKNLDLDDCFCITPTGHLILSVFKEMYYALGIEKGPAVSVFHDKDDFIQITINLKEECFVKGKNNYEKILKQLNNAKHDFEMDLLITWEPEDEKVCPSSIGAYFDSLGYTVDEKLLTMDVHVEYNLTMPPLSYDAEELFEWFGATLLGIKGITEDPEEEYLSSYTEPDEGEQIGQAVVFKAFGLFSAEYILKLLNILRDQVKENLWIGIHVQGFDHSPISWGLERHHYCGIGDNHYSLLIDNRGNVMANKISTTSLTKKKLRKKK